MGISKKIILILTFLLALLYLNNPVFAAKKRVRTSTQRSGTVSYWGYSKVSLRSDRRAIFINFTNLNNISKITYSLTYQANKIPQGVQGIVTPSGENFIQRELLFGTCSKNICTYHYGITNMKLLIYVTTKSGSVLIKPYRIRP